MFDEIRTGLGLRSGRRRARLAFVGVFGALWLALEPAGLFWPNTFDWGWAGYLGLLGASAAAAIHAARPPRSISRSLPPSNVVIEIRVGDLLAQQGNIIIGVADTFDTQLEDDVISPTSLQGQLLTRIFGSNRALLDAEITASVGTGTPDPTKSFGKTARHDIGTVAVVKRGSARYFLPAFTRMSATTPPNVTSSVEDLQVALARTWRAVSIGGQGEPAHAPIVGSHLARLHLSKTLLIQLVVLSFIAATRNGGPAALTVWIREEDRNIVDLAELDHWLSELCVS